MKVIEKIKQFMTKKKPILKETIRVVIPYKGKPIDDDKYISNKDCYLAEALRKKGYKDVKVLSYGHTIIGKDKFYPTKEFGCFILDLAFRQGESVEVILRKV